MIEGTKVQFIKDVTWGDLCGDVDDIHDKSEIMVPIWTVGYATGNGSQGWEQIKTLGQLSFMYPGHLFEVIPPTPQ